MLCPSRPARRERAEFHRKGEMMLKRVLLSSAVAGLVMGIAACSAPERSSDDLKTYDVEEQVPADMQPESASRAPGIVPTAAPGVAFAYHYGFRLPDAAISAAQEAHAGACERLGLAKCRITGMTYELDDRDRVEGSLELAIDPLLARGFGRDAIAVVEKREGKLRFARITGEDQNPVLDDAARREGDANRTIARLEADLAKARTENERVQLREQIRQLRAEVAAAQGAAATSEAKIQRTPMTFVYHGGAASRGFSGENPAVEAWYVFVDSLEALVSGGLKVLAAVLPWAVVLILVILALRSRAALAARAWWSRSAPAEKKAE